VVADKRKIAMNVTIAWVAIQIDDAAAECPVVTTAYDLVQRTSQGAGKSDLWEAKDIDYRRR
jgi:hypothetical protein